MTNFRPIHIISLGSLITFILLSTTLITLKATGTQISGSQIFIIALIATVISFLSFFFLVERFIGKKIKILYRSISKEKLGAVKTAPSISADILATAAKDTKEWIDERNSEITKLKDQEQFRREFLGNLAHELKTPVFSIQGYILTLLEGGLEDETVNRLFLERASKATDRMSSILNDLDEITKLEVDRVELQMSKFNIVELTTEVMESFEMACKEKNIELKFNKFYSSVMVEGDRGKLAQVLTNLISNSISYGNNGGKTQIKFFPMGDVIICEVADDGPGIAENLLPRLFERFYRVEQSRNRNEGGSGLGLSIVKHIIESHNQTINVRSTIGVGCTFSFTLKKA